MRGTFTQENLDFADDVLHLADLGFRHVSVEPASGHDWTTPSPSRRKTCPQVEAEYEKLATACCRRRRT